VRYANCATAVIALADNVLSDIANFDLKAVWVVCQ